MKKFVFGHFVMQNHQGRYLRSIVSKICLSIVHIAKPFILSCDIVDLK
jgi:hypothetical protein